MQRLNLSAEEVLTTTRALGKRLDLHCRVERGDVEASPKTSIARTWPL
jgi:hypothetical protein